MKLYFLEEEKDKIVGFDNYNLVSKNSLDSIDADILFVFDKSNLSSHIKDINYSEHYMFETENLDLIIVGSLELLRYIYDNYSEILDVKFDECYSTKCLYRFFRIKDRKFYSIVKNFKHFYYIEDPNGKYTAIDGTKVSRCYDYFNENSKKHYEKDINKFYRYSLEKNKSGKIKLGKNYRVCYYDIETNACVDAVNAPGEVLSIVGQDSLTKEVKSWIIDPDKNKSLIDQEKDMLTDFFIYVRDFDAITGWNTSKFDLPYLINRAIRIGVDPGLMSITNSPVSCKYKESDRINPWFIKIIGLNIYDLMTASARALAYLPEKLKDSKLDTVAEAILGETKIHTDTPAVLFRDKRIQELLDYNIQDVMLLMKIDEKLGTTELLIATLEFVPGMNLENSNYNSKIIDFYLLSKYDIIFPSVNREKITDIEGAVVFEPKSGIHDNVAVFDISGMYPSLIRTFNISPDRIITDKTDDCIHIHSDKAGDIYFDSSSDGILVQLINDFQSLRNRYKKLKKEHEKDPDYKLWELKEFAVKKILTSVYGVFGYVGFRLFDNRIANSITSAGRDLLNHMKDFAAKNGYVTVCGDTDSIFIKKDNEKKDTKHFEILIDDMNKSLDDYVKKFTTSERIIKNHYMNIEFETLFTRVIIAPAKKKYIGMVTKAKGRDLEEPVLFGKGNELVKKDVPAIIKQEIKGLVVDILKTKLTTLEVIDKIRYNLKEIKEKVRKSSVKDLLIYKEINRDFDQYKVLPQHVKAAINTNKELNTNFSRQNYKGGLLYVKALNGSGIDTLFLDPNYDFSKQNKFVVDYDKYISKFIIEKIKLIFGEEIYNEVNRKDNKLCDYF